MEFEFTSSVYIPQYDLEEIAKAVKNGIPFHYAFSNVLAGYDDLEWQAFAIVKNDVENYIRQNLL